MGLNSTITFFFVIELKAPKKSEAMPQQAQAENHLPSLYGSPGASWQDKQAEGENVNIKHSSILDEKNSRLP